MRFVTTKRKRWRWKKRGLLYLFLRHWLLEEVVDEEPRPEPVHVIEHGGCGAELYVNKTRWGREYVLRLGRYQLAGKSLMLVEFVTPEDIPDLCEVLLKAQRWVNTSPSGRRARRGTVGQARA